VGLLDDHAGGVATVAFVKGRANVVAQAVLQAAGARDALLQHLHAHAQVADRVERSMGAAEGRVLVVVDAGHHLHQPLGADGTLRKGVEAGFNRHDGQDEGRVQAGALAHGPGFLHQGADRLGCDLVAAGQPVRHG